MFKKALSLLLSLMLLVTSLSVAAASAFAADTATYVVAGTEALCGVHWNGKPEEATDNVMTAKGDGTYEKVFAQVEPAEDLQIKVVENTADGNQNWIGDSTGNNITFNVTTTSDVTVTFNPETQEITVTGDGVEFKTDLAIDAIYAVGNGDGAWLNGVNWDPAAEVNKMEEVSENVYEITFTGVEGPYEFNQVKFAANGSWADSWGGAYTESGVAFDADYNGDNINVNVPYALADITLTLDLSAFDYASKTGAKATINVVDASAPETDETTEATEETTEVLTEATTEETITEATEAPEVLTVKATSNLFPEKVQSFNAESNKVTVTYFFESEKDVLNAEWYLTYDPEVLKLNPEDNFNGSDAPNYMPVVGANGAVYNSNIPGQLNASASSLSLYSFSEKSAFVTVTFEVIGEGETAVDLQVKVLTLGEINPATFMADKDNQVRVAKNYVIDEAGYALVNVVDTTITSDAPETTEATTEATTVAETTATETTTEVPTSDPASPDQATPDVPVNDFTVKATSNFFPETSKVISETEKYVTVTYYFDSEKDLLNAEWALSFDSSVLTYSAENNESVMPAINSGLVVNSPEDGKIYGNCSSLSLYSFSGKTPFVTVVFEKAEGVTGETVVDLNVITMTLSEADATTGESKEDAEETVVKNSVVVSELTGVATDTVITAGIFTPEVPTTPSSAPSSPDETTVPETTATETTATETTVPEVVAPLTVTATSNFFPTSTEQYSADTKEVTVTYYLGLSQNLVNTEWYLTYDPEVLSVDPQKNVNAEGNGFGFMPQITSGAVYNIQNKGEIAANASSLSTYKITAGQPFVTVTFDVVGGGDTVVDLQVRVLSIGELDPNTFSVDQDSIKYYVSEYEVQDVEGVEEPVTDTNLTPSTFAPTTEAPTTEEPTTEEPTTEEPTTEAPTTEEPTTEAPTTEAPTTEEPTTEAPTTEAPTTEAPTTEAPTTEAPTTEAPTTEVPTTASDDEDATSDTGSTVATGSTSSNENKPSGSNTNNNNTGTVQTGSASMAVIILLALVSATGVIYFTRKRSSK